jgi:hypothetical protein
MSRGDRSWSAEKQLGQHAGSKYEVIVLESSHTKATAQVVRPHCEQGSRPVSGSQAVGNVTNNGPEHRGETVRLDHAGILIGKHLVREGPTWLLVIPGEEVKNKQTLEYALPKSLESYLQVYLDRVRPSFGPIESERPLWLTFEGTALDDHSIHWRFRLVTKRLLGVMINPHLLRDCAATSLSTESPAVARSAAAILGHRSFSTTERYYVRAKQLEASRTMNTTLSAIKANLK